MLHAVIEPPTAELMLDPEPPSLPPLPGERLRAMRLSRGLSLREAGRRAGLSASFVRLVELDQSRISVDRLSRLAAIYGAEISELVPPAHAESLPQPEPGGDEESTRRQQITAAAIDLIAERGIAADVLDELSERTGESLAYLRTVFDGDRSLLEQAVRLAARLTRAEIRRRWRSVDRAWARLELLLSVLSPVDEGADLMVVLWLEMLARSASDPALRRTQQELYRANLDLLRAVIELGQEEGSMRADVNPAVAAWQLAGIVDGLSLQVVAGSQDITAAQVRAITLQSAHDLLATSPESPERLR